MTVGQAGPDQMYNYVYQTLNPSGLTPYPKAWTAVSKPVLAQIDKFKKKKDNKNFEKMITAFVKAIKADP
jgi:hypothetical protein